MRELRIRMDRAVLLWSVIGPPPRAGLCRWLPLAPLLTCLATGAATAAEPVPVAPGQPITVLRRAVEVLEDPEGSLSIEEVLAPPVAARFRAQPAGRELTFGTTRSAYWFRFSLVNPAPRPTDLLLRIRYPLLDRIEFHAPGRPPLLLGDSLPFDERPIQARHFIVPLVVPAGATSIFHLRVETSGVLSLPLELGSPEHMLEVTLGHQLALGLLYGIFIGALVFNLFLWLWVRDSVNLYLVGHIFSVGYGLACIDGLAFQLWPTWTRWQQWSPHLAAVMVGAFTLLFVRSLVAGPQQSRRLDQALRLALWGLLVTCAVAAPFGSRPLLRVAMTWLALIGALLAVTVLRHAWRGHRGARIYAVAWGVFLLLMAFAAASSFGPIPHFFDFLIVARVAAAVEVLLAAIAVASNLREARQALAASETKFARAFRSSPDALTLSTLEDGRFIEVNDTFEKVSGYGRQEAVGRTSHELGLWRPGSRQALIETLARDGSVRQQETVLIHKDGHEVPVQFSVETIVLDGQSVLLATVRDITDRKAAAEQRQALIRELEAKNTELERFTYTASHDLRSPLVTILGFLGLLEKDIDQGDRHRFKGDLERIRAAANHMRQLLDELLELSRIGRVVSATQRVPLTVVAEEAASLLQRAINERRVDLRIARDLPTVRGDRTRLLQVLQNLLDNAVRFLGDQPRPRVEVGWRQDGAERVCFVRDNGIGIEASNQEAIFELFRRLQPGVEGTGVGLSLVRRIVESHGGRVWVESEGAGTGSTFCFVLPTAAT